MSGKNTTLARQVIGTPLGEMIAVASDKGIMMFEFAEGAHPERAMKELLRHLPGSGIQDRVHPLLTRLETEIGEYFAGRRTTFDVPLDPVGTPFQLEVWSALLKIPYGQTWSYAEEARAIGRPTAVRAVANANGRNRMPILIPCHRVIGSDGSLTGYSAGIQRKTALLALERRFLL